MFVVLGGAAQFRPRIPTRNNRLHAHLPIQDDSQRRRRVASNGVNQEFLSVASVPAQLSGSRPFAKNRNLEQLFGNSERGRARLHFNAHQFAIGGDVEQFLAIAAPTGLVAAAGGDGPLPGSSLGGTGSKQRRQRAS